MNYICVWCGLSICYLFFFQKMFRLFDISVDYNFQHFSFLYFSKRLSSHRDLVWHNDINSIFVRNSINNDIFSILFSSKIHKKIKTNQATYTLIVWSVWRCITFIVNKYKFLFIPFQDLHLIEFLLFLIAKLFLHQPKQFFSLSIRINIRTLKKYAKPRNMASSLKRFKATKENNKFERISHLFLNHFIVNCNIPVSFLLFRTIMKEKRHSRRNR